MNTKNYQKLNKYSKTLKLNLGIKNTWKGHANVKISILPLPLWDFSIFNATKPQNLNKC